DSDHRVLLQDQHHLREPAGAPDLHHPAHRDPGDPPSGRIGERAGWRYPMKRPISLQLLALLGLRLAACSADPPHVVGLNARAPGKQCDYRDNTLYVSGGSVDFRPYVLNGATLVTSQYFQVFSWENNLQSNEVSVNGQIVDNGSGNDF